MTKHLAASEAERITVALCMLKFEARTRTIRLATGLTEEQIRRHYHKAAIANTSARLRGRSPSSVTQFTRTQAAQLESSIISGVLITHGLLKGRRLKPWLNIGLQYASMFCAAYAEYLQIAHQKLSFEQAWYFARCLAARGEIYLQRCERCNSHFVRDLTTVLKHQCPVCKFREQQAPSKPHRKKG
jgi:hypothetical protein